SQSARAVGSSIKVAHRSADARVSDGEHVETAIMLQYTHSQSMPGLHAPRTQSAVKSTRGTSAVKRTHLRNAQHWEKNREKSPESDRRPANATGRDSECRTRFLSGTTHESFRHVAR